MGEIERKWEQRVRAPQLRAWSLLGPAVSWATDAERGVLLANLSGRFEVFAFDATSRPALLRQVTDRPQGTTGAAISQCGGYVTWFDDTDGDEIGRWVQVPFEGGDATVLLPDLPAAFGTGVVARRGGGAVVARVTDAGFALAVAVADGGGKVVFESPEQSTLWDADDHWAAISQARDGDMLHPVAAIIDLDTGKVVAELSDPGLGVRPFGISPAGDGRVLVGHYRNDRSGLLLWSPTTGDVQEVPTSIEGDITGSWLPDASGLLLVALQDGRHTVHRLDFATGSTEIVPLGPGVVDEYSARRDGSVHVLFESSVQAAQLLEAGGEPVVVLPGVPPITSAAAEDVYVEGPGGRVHAFLHRPVDGAAPYPTVFLVHGGPTWLDNDAFSVSVAALTDAGYAVVRVNYRGSTGYGRAWRDALRTRLGAMELEDISEVRAQLEADGVIDAERVAMAGGSWGGYLTLYSLGVQPDRWSAGVAMVPLADFAMSQEDQPAFMTAYDHVLFGGTLEEMPEEYALASALTYVDAVRTPLFITASANDPRCPPRPTDEYVERLRARGADVIYDRKESGHAAYDGDVLVHEIGTMLDFLASRMPADVQALS